jgi:hypothetical protein
MGRKFEGLWRREGSSYYVSKAFLKKDIADLLGDGEKKRLIIRHNKFWDREHNRPRYVFAFVDSKIADAITEEVPYIGDSDEGIDESIETVETDITKSVGGHCDDFEFREIFDYHDLLKCVGLGLHDEMPPAVSPPIQMQDGEYIREEHYIAHTFPNGDILSRIEVYCCDYNDNVKWHTSHSAIYGFNERGEAYQKLSHTRERELGMVLYYMEDCIREQCRSKKI